MANRYLLPIYERLYEKSFNYGEFDQRMEMQKAVYLLQNMGVPIGNYGFRWYKHGPYSQQLQDDMYFEKGRISGPVTLIREYSESVDRLYRVIHSNVDSVYSTSHWVECLASLHYLKENLLPYGAKEDDVVRALEMRKPHLAEHEINVRAYRLVEELFA